MALLGPEDRLRIEAAIASVEERTSGEVMVAVVPRSADYALPRAAAALLVAVGAAIGVHHLAPAVATDWLLLGVAPLAVALYTAWGMGPLLRLLVPRVQADAAARLRAELLFFQRRLHETRERTGLLLLVSEAEHRVVVLGDRAIDALIRPEGWAAHVDTLARAIAGGRAAEGLVATVTALGELLAQHFPRRAGDVNELGNAVLIEEP